MERLTSSTGMINRYILLSDIVGSSRLQEKYPREYSDALDRHNTLTEQTVARCGGEIFKSTGDGYYAFFDSGQECIDCAAKLASEFAKFPSFAEDDQFQVRIIAHHGEMRAVGTEFFGKALNRASRLCQVCHPGQVICSDPAKPALHELPEGVSYVDLGMHHLRDLASPEHLYQLKVPGLQQEFPALPTLKNRPNNLIELPNAFIGREHELVELSQLLNGHRLVSIIAPGGYGKSRIAAQLCANLLDSFGRGVFFVELAPVREHTGIASALAGATGFQFYGTRDPKMQLIDFLREKEMLICFDNFEQVLDGASFITDILTAARGVKAIVTSREPLRISGEQVYKLQPLPAQDEHSDAVVLFTDRATLVNSGFGLDTDSLHQVKGICDLLSGIPMAIEIAAAWMDSFTLPELLEELAEQLELTARISDVPERHRSLRASLDWSWKLLDDDHRKVLMAMSTFRGGCFADAASAVLQMKGMKLRGGLARLVDKSWMYTRDIDAKTRFYLRDASSREYAYEKLEDTKGEPDSLYESSVIAHAKYYSEIMGREGVKLHGHGQLESLKKIGQEKQNIYEALDTLLNRLKPEDVSEQLVESLLPIARWLWEYMNMTSALREMVERYQVLKDVAYLSGVQQQILLWAHSGCCCGQLNLGDLDAAHSEANRANAVAKALNDRYGQAASLNSIGKVDCNKGNYDIACDLHAESLAIFREIGDGFGIAVSLHSIGNVKYYQGNYDEARELYTDSLAICREIGDRFTISRSLNNLGNVECTLGNYDAARELHAESLAIDREIGNRRGIASSFNNLGLVEDRQGNYDAACEMYTESLAIHREVGNRLGIANCLNSLGVVEYYKGNYDMAHELYVESLAMNREIGDRFVISILLYNLAFTESSQNNYDAARELYAESLAISRGIGNSEGICRNLSSIGCQLATIAQAQAGATCLYGAQYHATSLGFIFDAMECELQMQVLAIIKHPDTGLPLKERERLQAQAEAMSLDELAQYALDALAKQ